jgi:protein gp37
MWRTWRRYPRHVLRQEEEQPARTNNFGIGKERHLNSRKNLMKLAMKINHQCEHGRLYRAFNGSTCDFFDSEWDPAWRRWWWHMIYSTPHNRHMIISKRLNLALRLNMMPPGWPRGYEHVTLLGTVAVGSELERVVDALMSIEAYCHGVIFEPQLEEIDPQYAIDAGVDWYITGGESGDASAPAAPYHLEWARTIRVPVVRAGLAFFMKQGGSNPYYEGKSIKLKEHDGRLVELSEDLRERVWPPQMTEPRELLLRRKPKTL